MSSEGHGRGGRVVDDRLCDSRGHFVEVRCPSCPWSVVVTGAGAAAAAGLAHHQAHEAAPANPRVPASPSPAGKGGRKAAQAAPAGAM